MSGKTFETQLAQYQSPLFSLPLELREIVYHHLCITSGILKQQFVYPTPLISNTTAPRHGHGHCAHNLLAIRYRSPCPDSLGSYWSQCLSSPVWLLTCKAVMHEGLNQLLRNAEWHYHGYLASSVPWSHSKLSLLRLNTRYVTRFELHVQNLANYESPARGEGTNTKEDLGYIASLMRAGGMSMKTIRFVGHSYRLTQWNLDCDGQIENMTQNLVSIFDGIEVERWEFGVREPNDDSVWLLFNYIPSSSSSGEDTRGHLALMVKEKKIRMPREVREKDDLEKLLPEGWVKKREPCECELCQEQRNEGGVGGFKDRPDQFGLQPYRWARSQCSRYWTPRSFCYG